MIGNLKPISETNFWGKQIIAINCFWQMHVEKVSNNFEKRKNPRKLLKVATWIHDFCCQPQTWLKDFSAWQALLLVITGNG